jgi:NAD(P)-dependent dehydrogenase (short-subunit alcohol dehydrogenase family)
VLPPLLVSGDLPALAESRRGPLLVTRIDAEGAVLAMMERVGPVDILVHISCPQHIAPVETFPSDTWRRILDVGVTSAFLMSRAVLPHMRAKGWGRIEAIFGRAFRDYDPVCIRTQESIFQRNRARRIVGGVQ